MKICVYGAGAIGGYVAVQLARAGQDVSVVARGPHLKAIQANGLALKIAGETHVAKIPASDDPAALGKQDYVVVALKAHQIPPAAAAIKSLCGPGTAILFAVNGVPWWYFHKLAGPYENRRIEAVDPGGAIWDTLGPERALGCVVMPAAEIAAPGVVEVRAYSREESDRLLEPWLGSGLSLEDLPVPRMIAIKVAPVRALIGLKATLPQSLIQISSRMRLRTGARSPAAIIA